MIALAACLIGLIAYWVCIALGAYLGWGATTVPGHEQFLRGHQLLIDADHADANLTDAVKEFDKAIAANRLHALAVFYQAKAYQLLGKTDLALAGYTDAVRRDKEIAGMGRAEREQARRGPLGFELADAYFNRATLRNQAGQSDEAIEDFASALRLNRQYPDAYRGKGAAYLKKGNAEQAILELNEAISLAPDSPESLCLRARAHLAAGSYARASDDARRAIQLDARCGDAFLTLGSASLSSPYQPRDAAVRALMDALPLQGCNAAERCCVGAGILQPKRRPHEGWRASGGKGGLRLGEARGSERRVPGP